MSRDENGTSCIALHWNLDKWEWLPNVHGDATLSEFA